ncbi:hypothetical protein ACFE04_027020 [Oxalis oulophora]
MDSARKMMKARLSLLLVLVLMITSAVCAISRQNNKQELLDHLKRLNKPYVKTIKSSDGDIIDCVNLADQPAFDHPLLMNHTIQLSPSFDPDQNKENDKIEGAEPFTQLWQLNGTCPQGTIPIIRTKKRDLLRASSIEAFGKKRNSTVPRPRFVRKYIAGTVHEYATAYVRGGKYYGTKAILNVWEPHVDNEIEFSLSQIWLVGGSPAHDTIEAGWHVNPQNNGDYQTRFFIYWTSDGYEHTGCYNLRCQGFVQTNNKVAVGGTLRPLSTYDSDDIFGITLSFWKDPHTNNWWLKYGEENVGYWPASLFTILAADSASEVQWGGEVLLQKPDGRHSTTQMGSGHFAEEGLRKASYIKNMQLVDEYTNLRDPWNIATYESEPNCYNAKFFNALDQGKYVFFGGPGRNPNCP